MLTEDTMRKLHEMRLTVMARTLREQLQDPLYNDMPFEDRVSLLVDREWCARKNNQLARLKKAAHFADPSACVENIEYHADRCLDKAKPRRLAGGFHRGAAAASAKRSSGGAYKSRGFNAAPLHREGQRSGVPLRSAEIRRTLGEAPVTGS